MPIRILLLVLFWPAGLLAQVGTDSRLVLEQALARYQLAEAEAALPSLSPPGYRAFYEATLLMYKSFGTQDPIYLRRLRGDWDTRLAQLETLSTEDPLKGVMMAELHAKRSLLEFLDGNYFTAVRYARSSRMLVKRNQRSFPTNVEQGKTLGLFNVLLASLPRRYQWITDALGFSGDLIVGQQQLETAAQQGKLLPLEAGLLLAYVEKNLLNDGDKAIARLRTMRAQHGSNQLLDYFLATGLMGVKANDEAIGILQAWASQEERPGFDLPHWNYQLGKAYYHRHDLALAQRYLAAFLRDYQGSLFRADANFRLGMALTLDGQYPLGRYFFTQVDATHSSLDEDAYARHMAAHFALAPPPSFLQGLFRARNYFDGGYYEKALQVLQGYKETVNTQPVAYQTEWHYRMGRVLHAQGAMPQAESHYARCIAQPDQQEVRWLRAYAWYYRGDIARSQGQLALARTAFEQALALDDYFYQNGLEGRCRAGLATLREAERQARR